MYRFSRMYTCDLPSLFEMGGMVRVKVPVGDARRQHRRAGAAHRYLVQHRDFRFRQAEQFAGIGGLRLCQLHLAEDGARDQPREFGADDGDVTIDGSIVRKAGRHAIGESP